MSFCRRGSFLRGGSEQLDKIPSFRYHLGPRCSRGDEKRILQLFLTISQRSLIGLNLVKIPTNFGVFLSGHTAVLVKIDRRISHRRATFSSGPGRRLGRMSATAEVEVASFILADLGFLSSRLLLL
jgi:hypothetical protein